MMFAVVDSSTNGSPTEVEQGILANLPRTRPQRASARRAAARDNARVATAPAARRTRPTRKQEAPRPRRRATQPTPRATQPAPSSVPARRRVEKAPPQGYECDEATSMTVHPPGGAELVVSATEVIGELAKAGISRGERIVKDLFERLPLS